VNGRCRHLVLPVSVPVPVSLGSSVHGGNVSGLRCMRGVVARGVVTCQEVAGGGSMSCGGGQWSCCM
jgi:hypothetical protein